MNLYLKNSHYNQIDSVDNAGFNGFEDSDDFFYIRFNEIEKANILVEF